VFLWRDGPLQLPTAIFAELTTKPHTLNPVSLIGLNGIQEAGQAKDHNAQPVV